MHTDVHVYMSVGVGRGAHARQCRRGRMCTRVQGTTIFHQQYTHVGRQGQIAFGFPGHAASGSKAAGRSGTPASIEGDVTPVPGRP